MNFATFVIVDHELKKILEKSQSQEKENRLFLKKLRKGNKKQIDTRFHNLHEETFKKIDCLDCANCCKTTSPIFRDQDIKKLSKLFKMKEQSFIQEYLKIDEDDDYVLQSSPCPFLLDDNKCFVYDVRPQACREYPHTDRKNMHQILTLTYKNTLVCPAVATIVENFKNSH